MKLDSTITCLKAFGRKALVGTKCGKLIILDINLKSQPILKFGNEYQLSRKGITSIRLRKLDNSIHVIVCFDENKFIRGKLCKNNLEMHEDLHRDHLVHDARYVKGSTTPEPLTIGLREEDSELCIQHEKAGKIRSLFPYKGREILPPKILDISERGMIFVDYENGLVSLRDSSDSTVVINSSIGNSLTNNKGGIGLLIPNGPGYSIIYAGAKLKELNITAFLPHKALSAKFDWHPREDRGENYISSIDYHKDSIVLGLRCSIIVFKLDSKSSMPRKPDKLCEALREYHENRSSMEKAESEDKSDSESTELQESQASDSEIDELQESQASEFGNKSFESGLESTRPQLSNAQLTAALKDVDRCYDNLQAVVKEIKEILKNRPV